MKWLKIFRPFIFTLVASPLASPVLYAQTTELTVRSGGLRQSFAGFGFSQPSQTGFAIPATNLNQIMGLLGTNLHAKYIRLWVDAFQNTDGPITITTMTNEFYTRYIHSGALTTLAQQGITNLLLAPTEIYTDKPAGPPNEGVSAYASRLATFISLIKTEWGVNINTTGMANEPNSWSPQNVVDCVNDLRADLNSNGLANVGIIAPEWGVNDTTLNAALDAMFTNATAWSGLEGIASHSYGMSPGNDQQDRKRTKEFWMTEASEDTGTEVVEDDNRASTISARFLNDMNHLVDRWIFFIGFAPVTGNVFGATELMAYDQASSKNIISLKYYYLKQMLDTFDQGAIFRKCDSATETDMWYTYGQKPAMNAAAAMNPDGSWGIGIVNDTGASYDSGSGLSTNGYYPAITNTVNLIVQELTNVPSLTFSSYSSRSNQHFAANGTVTLVNGKATITIAPKQLICLRSAPAARTVPPVPADLTCFGGSTGNLLDWDNTAWAVGWNVKRATTNGSYTVIATTTTTQYTDTNVVGGTTYFYAVSAVNGLGESMNSATATVWANTDIGSVGLAGSVAHVAPTFTINGAGSSIGGTSDSCQYVYQTMTGDGTIIARIASTTGVQDGLAMRETTNSNAANVTVLMSANYGGSQLYYRTTTGGGTSSANGLTGISLPRWYKLSRAANTFTGYVSTNGTAWITVGSASVSMANTITVGMEVCRRLTDTLAITRFDYVTPAVLPISWQPPGSWPPLVARYPISGETDVLTNGAMLYAYDWANVNEIVNGVFFAGVNSTNGASMNVSFANLGGGISNNINAFGGGAASPWSGLSTRYKYILQGADYACNNNTTITVSLNNLTVGKTYAVQFWVNDSRSGGTGTNTETAFSGSGSQVTLAYNVQQAGGGLGEYMLFYFTPTAPSQSFTLLGLGAGLTQINALQVRDVTGFSPIVNSATMGSHAGSVVLSFAGLGGYPFRILTSPNLALALTNWLLLTNGTFGAGNVNYTDEAATNRQGFYRIASP